MTKVEKLQQIASQHLGVENLEVAAELDSADFFDLHRAAIKAALEAAYAAGEAFGRQAAGDMFIKAVAAATNKEKVA